MFQIGLMLLKLGSVRIANNFFYCISARADPGGYNQAFAPFLDFLCRYFLWERATIQSGHSLGFFCK